jgi:tetratricopeptide (TPR) repeat protein
MDRMTPARPHRSLRIRMRAWRMRAGHIRATVAASLLVVASILLCAASPLRAQAVERAVTRGEWTTLDAAAVRLRTAIAGPDARDPWTHYDLGYVLHRRASALLIAKRTDQAKPLLEESERALTRAQSLGGGATATALRGAVTGQLAGTGGALNAMRMGLNGMSRLNAPRAFGGGPAKAEPELRRAVALFTSDAPTAQNPNWGRADAHIWLGIALEQLGRRDEARVELQRALAIAPAHAWVTRELLPRLDAAP